MAAAEINAGAIPGVRINVKTVDDLSTTPGAAAAFGVFVRDRSEEHTSELQSH